MLDQGFMVRQQGGLPPPGDLSPGEVVFLSGSLNSEVAKGKRQAIEALLDHAGPIVICEPAMLAWFDVGAGDEQTYQTRVGADQLAEARSLVAAGHVAWATPPGQAMVHAHMPGQPQQALAFTVARGALPGDRIFLGLLWLFPRAGGQVSLTEAGWQVVDTILRPYQPDGRKAGNTLGPAAENR